MCSETEKRVLQNIKSIRRAKGISQESIAYDLGIDYSTYGKMERRKIQLTVSRLEEISKILQTSIEELYGFSNRHNTGRISELEHEIEVLNANLMDKERIITLLENK